MDKWIRFDIEKIKELKTSYELTLEAIKDQLPSINWNSPKQIVHFMSKEFDINLEDARISTLQDAMNSYPEDSPQHEALNEALYVLRLKYFISNYLAAILRHENDGIVPLRNVSGTLCLPNRRPLPEAAEITACIVASHY